MTILLSSHLLTEVQEVCNRVAVINDGRIVHEGSLAELDANTTTRYRVHTSDDVAAAAALGRVRDVQGLRREQDVLSFTLASNAETVAVTRALADAGVGIRELAREQTTLEELFFRLTESTDATAAVAA